MRDFLEHKAVGHKHSREPRVGHCECKSKDADQFPAVRARPRPRRCMESLSWTTVRK